ncbi:hypothetical protein CKA55_12770 [Arcobacter suis]|uniref:Glycosyltransferase, family 2 n=1 Tax=Arcobacter suis CECT 7833 TaxID=663365 RepID=A0AAD0SSZ1_9BACT|nr:glycosyltransferase [Arcobacter suis]AXX90515.1 glycosyltransferase, family 2 [Arcobacter suis CECT 7833]RWS45449.1 hypothetical protein CKA55_12770 [Arcobacter suis]
MKKLISICIPIYNHEKYIEQCLESIINQTYTNFEIIMIDDGSNDNSYFIAQNYLNAQKFSNYILKKRENKGLCYTLNELLSLSRGEYISITASDDYWMLNKLEEQIDFLSKNQDVALVHSNSIIVDDCGNQKGEIDYSNRKNSGYLFKAIIFSRGGINTVSTMIRREVYAKIGNYDSSLKFEDTDFWLRLTKKFKVGYINKFHTYYRRHDSNLSDDKNKLKFTNDEIVKIFNKNIEDSILKKSAILRIYRKSYLLALRTFNFKYLAKYLFKYFIYKYWNKL